jgi:hypothetical protein
MEFLIDALNDEVKKFDLNQLPTTNVISVYRKRDLIKVEAILYVLSFKYATHEVAGNHFEVIFN